MGDRLGCHTFDGQGLSNLGEPYLGGENSLASVCRLVGNESEGVHPCEDSERPCWNCGVGFRSGNARSDNARYDHRRFAEHLKAIGVTDIVEWSEVPSRQRPSPEIRVVETYGKIPGGGQAFLSHESRTGRVVRGRRGGRRIRGSG